MGRLRHWRHQMRTPPLRRYGVEVVGVYPGRIDLRFVAFHRRRTAEAWVADMNSRMSKPGTAYRVKDRWEPWLSWLTG